MGCAPPRAPDLVIVSLDTVRRDHLSVYGYDRPTTPFLEALAERSAVFEEAFAQETNTAPSHASLFTGLYPHEHGATANGVPLPEGPATLAEAFAAAGYRTGAFVSGFTLGSQVAALDRGFSVWDDELPDEVRRDGRDTLDRALAWLGEGGTQPTFLFLHLFDAHGPYLPHGEELARFHRSEPGPRLDNVAPHHQLTYSDGRRITGLWRYEDRYDAQIHYVDGLVRELVSRFDLERTIVLVFADHGESLGERYHQIDHGAQLFDEQLRVPLLLSAPGVSARRIEGLAETVDVASTLLRLAGIGEPGGWAPAGRTLDPLLAGSPEAGRRAVFSAARSVPERHADRGYPLDPDRRLYSVRSRAWKLIRYPLVEGSANDHALELYDLRADPLERSNLAGAEPERAQRLLRALEQWLGDGEATGVDPEALDPETRKRLEALGYVG